MISKHARSNSEVFLLMVSKHAWSDSEAFQLWPFRPACIQNWASFCIWFSSGFPKKAWIILSDLDDLVSFGLNTSCAEASRCNATGPLPLSHFHTRLHCSTDSLNHIVQKPTHSHFHTQLHCSTDILNHIVQNQPRSNLVLADSVLAQQIWSGSKPVYKNHLAHFWPTLPSWSWLDADQLWHFTGQCPLSHFWQSTRAKVPWG